MSGINPAPGGTGIPVEDIVAAAYVVPPHENYTGGDVGTFRDTLTIGSRLLIVDGASEVLAGTVDMDTLVAPAITLAVTAAGTLLDVHFDGTGVGADLDVAVTTGPCATVCITNTESWTFGTTTVDADAFDSSTFVRLFLGSCVTTAQSDMILADAGGAAGGTGVVSVTNYSLVPDGAYTGDISGVAEFTGVEASSPYAAKYTLVEDTLYLRQIAGPAWHIIDGSDVEVFTQDVPSGDASVAYSGVAGTAYEGDAIILSGVGARPGEYWLAVLVAKGWTNLSP